MNAEDDGRLDRQADSFMAGMVRLIREDVVNGLLAGSDVRCFTVGQYVARYQSTVWGSEVMPLKTEVAERHLRSLPDLVREVRPGVWAAVEGNP